MSINNIKQKYNTEYLLQINVASAIQVTSPANTYDTGSENPRGSREPWLSSIPGDHYVRLNIKHPLAQVFGASIGVT